MNGIDFAGWRPGAQWIASSGFGFVIRYLKWLPNAYAIDAGEFTAYRAAGIHVVLNWEQTAKDQLDGASAGAVHAAEALRQAQLLGAWPCAIYFSADWDVSAAEQATCNAYLAAAGQVLGRQYVGAYGSYYYIQRALAAGVISWAWQTFAWSGGLWHPDAHIRQTAVGQNYDSDTAMTDNFGQVGGATQTAATSSRQQENEMLGVILVGPNGAQWAVLPNGYRFGITSQENLGALKQSGQFASGGQVSDDQLKMIPVLNATAP